MNEWKNEFLISEFGVRFVRKQSSSYFSYLSDTMEEYCAKQSWTTIRHSHQLSRVTNY